MLRKLQEIPPTLDNQNATDGHIAALLVKPDMQNHRGMAHLHRKAMAGQPTPRNEPHIRNKDLIGPY